jgi:hypothetical protein
MDMPALSSHVMRTGAGERYNRVDCSVNLVENLADAFVLIVRLNASLLLPDLMKEKARGETAFLGDKKGY